MANDFTQNLLHLFYFFLLLCRGLLRQQHHQQLLLYTTPEPKPVTPIHNPSRNPEIPLTCVLAPVFGGVGNRLI